MSIDEIAKLQKDWNNNGSDAPSELLIRRGRAFEKILGDGWSCYPIAGSPMGIEFEKRVKGIGYVLIDVYEDEVEDYYLLEE